MPRSSSSHATLVWFRRDLRLDDHVPLCQALAAGRPTHCVFVFDTDILDSLRQRRDRRVAFIHASVAALRQDLRALGGDLHVLHGPARQLLPDLAARLDAAEVHAGRDGEPFAAQRDAAVAATLAAQGRRLLLHEDQVIFGADEVCTVSGRPYHVFTPYKRTWLARLEAGQCAAHVPDLRCLAPAPAGPMPTLADMDFEPVDLAAVGIATGEAGARAAWEAFRDRLPDYHRTRDFPALAGTSRLSVHLRFGTLSIRTLVRHARAAAGEGAETWLSELIWREFYQMLLTHYPDTPRRCFQSRYDAIRWPNPAGHFEAWCAARTGYPLVDAALRQLHQTGFMHNRLRMVVASFLVKDLHVDWRRGEGHFAEHLLDYDQAANVGNWQWCASVGTDAQPWFRIFNPVNQSERFDPEGRFIRDFVPELGSVPARYVHAPWRMPAATQQASGVVIGRDYPAPIVDHGEARRATLAMFKACS